MVLHRDIYWLGRQWCVTGFGIQAIDKKLSMRFDIPVARIYDIGLSEGLEAEPWFDRVDFAEAVEIARRLSLDNPRSFQAQPGNEK